MRTQHTVAIATPQARVREVVQHPPRALRGLAEPREYRAELLDRDVSSSANHARLERRA